MKKVIPILLILLLVGCGPKQELKVAQPDEIEEVKTENQTPEVAPVQSEETKEVDTEVKDENTVQITGPAGMVMDYNAYFGLELPNEKEKEILDKVLATKAVFLIDGKEFNIPFSLDEVKANFDIVEDNVTDNDGPDVLHQMVDSNGKKFDGIFNKSDNRVVNWRWHFTDYPVTPPLGIEAYESFDTAIDKIDPDLITNISFNDNGKIVTLLMDHSEVILYFPDDGGLVMFDAYVLDKDERIGQNIRSRDIKWRKELIDYKQNK